jgi:hypothetical protein
MHSACDGLGVQFIPAPAMRFVFFAERFIIHLTTLIVDFSGAA